jgi:phosphatidylglycerol:prolipoprotein diacylglycerol transferase
VWPIFTRLFDYEIGTFGVFMGLALLMALWVARHLGKRDDLDPRRVNDIGLATLAAAIIGSKLLAVVVLLLSGVSVTWAELRTAGAVHGALLGAMVTIFVLSRSMKLPVDKLFDAYIPATALGQAVGRLGCLAAGCCFGTQSALPWAVTFTDPKALDLGGVPLHTALHPVQLYDAGLHLLMFAILFALHRRRRLVGKLFAPWCILEGCARFFIETFRGDLGRGVWFDVSWLSTGRVTSLVMIALGSALILRGRYQESGDARQR